MLRLLFHQPLLRKGSLGQPRKCGELPGSAGDKSRIALSISFFLYAFLNFKAYVNGPGWPRARCTDDKLSYLPWGCNFHMKIVSSAPAWASFAPSQLPSAVLGRLLAAAAVGVILSGCRLGIFPAGLGCVPAPSFSHIPHLAHSWCPSCHLCVTHGALGPLSCCGDQGRAWHCLLAVPECRRLC